MRLLNNDKCIPDSGLPVGDAAWKCVKQVVLILQTWHTEWAPSLLAAWACSHTRQAIAVSANTYLFVDVEFASP